jgi:hypothetical protein
MGQPQIFIDLDSVRGRIAGERGPSRLFASRNLPNLIPIFKE